MRRDVEAARQRKLDAALSRLLGKKNPTADDLLMIELIRAVYDLTGRVQGLEQGVR